DEESGSQVVALDEEEVEQVPEEDEVQVEVDEEGDFGDLEGEEDVEVEADDTRPAREVEVVKLIKPAPWGMMPMVVMGPCVVGMLLVGLVGCEMVQSSVAHRPPGMMTRALNDNVLAPMSLTKPFGK